jgi:hypothetical protein
MGNHSSRTGALFANARRSSEVLDAQRLVTSGKTQLPRQSVTRPPSPARKSHSFKRLLAVVKFRSAVSVHVAA